jgi:hypothetical protein
MADRGRRDGASEYVAGRDPVSGTVYFAMLGLFALMPVILARVQVRRLPSDGEPG